jgi:hypothetical protein
VGHRHQRANDEPVSLSTAFRLGYSVDSQTGEIGEQLVVEQIER